MASADFSLRHAPLPFQARGEISPGKNAILPRITAGSTRRRFDHKSFAVMCLLALLRRASYPILVHRLAVSFHASFPRSVTLTQLHFLSFPVASLREDFHLQDRAYAGRTHPPLPEGREFLLLDGHARPRPEAASRLECLAHRSAWHFCLARCRGKLTLQLALARVQDALARVTVPVGSATGARPRAHGQSG